MVPGRWIIPPGRCVGIGAYRVRVCSRSTDLIAPSRITRLEGIWGWSETSQNKLWHQKLSLQFTEVLWRLEFRVMSMLLGIGPCKCIWGDVKHLKTRKRVHTKIDLIKKSCLYKLMYKWVKSKMSRCKTKWNIE